MKNNLYKVADRDSVKRELICIDELTKMINKAVAEGDLHAAFQSTHNLNQSLIQLGRYQQERRLMDLQTQVVRYVSPESIANRFLAEKKH